MFPFFKVVMCLRRLTDCLKEDPQEKKTKTKKKNKPNDPEEENKPPPAVSEGIEPDKEDDLGRAVDQVGIANHLSLTQNLP